LTTDREWSIRRAGTGTTGAERIAAVTVALSSRPPSRRTVRLLGAAVAALLVAGVVAIVADDQLGIGPDKDDGDVLSEGNGRDRALAGADDEDAKGKGKGKDKGKGSGKGGAGGPGGPRVPGFLAMTVEAAGGCDGGCADETTIWVAREDGAARSKVTSPRSSYDRFPRWAPDGSALAFTRVDRESGAGEIHVMAVKGDGLAEPRQVTRTERFHDGHGCRGSRLVPEWSPDGRRIAATCTQGDRGDRQATVVVAGVPGGKQFEVAPDTRFAESSPAWAPDGRALAFSRLDLHRRYAAPGRRQLWVAPVSAAGVGAARALVTGPHASDHPRFSPKGDRLLYVATDERSLATSLELVGADGKPAGRVYAAPPRSLTKLYAAEWSPDGGRVAFPVGDGLSTSVLHVVDVGGAVRPFPVDSSLAFAPAWSPDGQRVAIDLVRRGERGDRHDVATVDPAGGPPAPIEIPGAYAYDPTFRPT
jgi:Tol biopolymer transport system component